MSETNNNDDDETNGSNKDKKNTNNIESTKPKTSSFIEDFEKKWVRDSKSNSSIPSAKDLLATLKKKNFSFSDNDDNDPATNPEPSPQKDIQSNTEQEIEPGKKTNGDVSIKDKTDDDGFNDDGFNLDIFIDPDENEPYEDDPEEKEPVEEIPQDPLQHAIKPPASSPPPPIQDSKPVINDIYSELISNHEKELDLDLDLEEKVETDLEAKPKPPVKDKEIIEPKPELVENSPDSSYVLEHNVTADQALETIKHPNLAEERNLNATNTPIYEPPVNPDPNVNSKSVSNAFQESIPIQKKKPKKKSKKRKVPRAVSTPNSSKPPVKPGQTTVSREKNGSGGDELPTGQGQPTYVEHIDPPQKVSRFRFKPRFLK